MSKNIDTFCFIVIESHDKSFLVGNKYSVVEGVLITSQGMCYQDLTVKFLDTLAFKDIKTEVTSVVYNNERYINKEYLKKKIETIGGKTSAL